MNLKAVVSALLAASLITSGMALAQGRVERERGRSNHAQRGGKYGGQVRAPARREAQAREDRYRGRAEHGAGPYHSFRRGDRLPIEYRHHNYVIDDWRAYRLNRPPRGYHWVQIGGEFILVSIGNGLIFQVIIR